MTTKLLFDEEPLVVQPSLAKLIGLNEAIVVQQLHYWLRKSEHFFEGRTWIYNTYADWQEQFPFWSKRTLERLIPKIEKDGLILTGNFNKAGFDNTKWYTLDYNLLNCLRDGVDDTANLARRHRQSGDIHTDNVSRGNRQDDEFRTANLSRPIPENNTEITSESNSENNTPPPTTRGREDAIEIWNGFLNATKNEIPRSTFEIWFKSAKPISYERKTLTIACMSEMHRDWLYRYAQLIKETLQKLAKDQEIAVKIEVIEPDIAQEE